MGWFRTDRELAATKYAGRESASDRRNRKAAARGSMGRPSRNARDAANAGEDYRLGQRTRRR